MTLVVGFNCQDGIVLAADSEVSDAENRWAEPKSWFFRYPTPLKVGVVGAGDMAFIQYAALGIEEAVQPDMSLQDIRDTIDEVLSEVHKEHIYPYNSSRATEAFINLIVGVVSTEGRFIVGTDLTTSAPINVFRAYGTGASLARFLVSRSGADTNRIDIIDASFLSVQALKHAGRSRIGVGGKSRVMMLHQVPHLSGWLSQPGVKDYERFGDEFDAAIQPVFLTGVKRGVSDEEFNHAVEGLRSKLLAITNRRRDHVVTPEAGQVRTAGYAPTVTITEPLLPPNASQEVPEDSSKD